MYCWLNLYSIWSSCKYLHWFEIYLEHVFIHSVKITRIIQTIRRHPKVFFYLCCSWSQNMSRCFRNISTDSASIKTCSCTLSSLMSVLCVSCLCNEFRYFLSFLNRSVFPLEQEVISRGVAINSGTVNCNCKDLRRGNVPSFSCHSHSALYNVYSVALNRTKR